MSIPRKNALETDPGDLGAALKRAIELVESVGCRVDLSPSGGPLVAIVPLDDLRRLEELDAAEDRIDVEAVRASQDEPSITLDELRARLGL